MKAIVLARVSTKRQEEEGLSLDNQLETLRDYAAKAKIEVVKEFCFQESAGHKIRKRFDEMIAYVKEHDDVTAILAYRVDRTTRNFRDAVALDNLRIEQNKELHFVYNRLVLRADSHGRDIQDWDLQVFLAKQYLNRLQEDGANTWLSKIRHGEWSGKAPCGYKNVPRADDANKVWIVLDEERAPLIRKAFEWYAVGDISVKRLAKKLRDLGLTTNTEGQRPMYTSYLEHHILRNPFFYGEMLFKGKLYPHHYEPLIPKWLFMKCQQVRENWGKKPFKWGGKTFTFKGLLACPMCGRVLSSYEQKAFTYVRCANCKAVHCREDKLLPQAAAIFDSMTIPEAVVKDLTERLRAGHDAERDFYEQNVSRIQGELGRIEKRKRLMYEDRLDGRITHDDYDKMIEATKERERQLHNELASHQVADETFMISCSYLLELLQRASDLFARSQAAQKNHLLRFVLANASVEGEKLIYELKSPFSGIVQCAKSKEWLPRLDSNQQPIG